MKMYRDRQIKHFIIFLFGLAGMLGIFGMLFFSVMKRSVLEMYLNHNHDMVSSLLEQGVPEAVVARAVTASEGTGEGGELLGKIGLDMETDIRLISSLGGLQNKMLAWAGGLGVILVAVLFSGAFLFLYKREKLYETALHRIGRYMEGDFSKHLPGMEEGTVYRLFTSVDRLAAALQSQNETQQKARQFLKDTISDISHQLKTPLAAMRMYNEIIAGDADHPQTVLDFGEKTERALDRMQQLIQSMLKITRLDAGSIVFEKKPCIVRRIIEHGIGELMTRSMQEGKNILLEGEQEEIVCDFEWTAEAVGNIVKNALDHTQRGAIIKIRWESTPVIHRIFISDNGSGVDDQDIHHIFKRFYRSRDSLDTQGIGLGLPLVKSIMEGQGGIVSVKNGTESGATFILSFPVDGE